MISAKEVSFSMLELCSVALSYPIQVLSRIRVPVQVWVPVQFWVRVRVQFHSRFLVQGGVSAGWGLVWGWLSSRDRGNFGDGNFGGGNFDIYIWFGKWNGWFRVGLSSRDRGNIGALSRFPTNKTRGLRR